MKQKLLGFKRLFKEEKELNQKISLLTEKDNNNENIDNNFNIGDINSKEENTIELKENE